VANTQDGYDFNIPAMETRRAFIYASADADVSSSAFANSIYVAWTDTTAAESGTAANNHGRIQVAYSRDGGATWTIRTPHETADANTVDRFHPWLGVGPDGKVYVMFYDTRRSATRVGVDVFYSVSSDGGNTWATPTRVTSVLSPQIDTGFEWGDYNGLDIVGNQLITIFTDNRNEGEPGARHDLRHEPLQHARPVRRRHRDRRLRRLDDLRLLRLGSGGHGQRRGHPVKPGQ
jgi:Neuraminidase (sialidase)